MTIADHIKYVDVDGIRTRYYEAGRGAPLVLVHGGAMGTGSSLGIFDQNLDELARTYHVFALDKIGQGHTDNPKTDADFTIERMTRHVYRFITAVGLTRTYLIGQSRGAFNGIEICLDAPGLVRGFILCNSASMAPGVEAIPAFSKKARAEAPHEPGSKEWVRYRSQIMCYSDVSLTDAYIDEWHGIHHLPKSAVAREKMRTLGPRQFEPSVDRAKDRVFERLRCGELRVPILVHWGMNDPSAPFETDGMNVFRLLSANAAAITLHVVNHAGHFAFREKSAEFNRLVPAYFGGLT
jgi:2-hydroxy-6-oxo-6-(2'-carboxyphenyl)-hexa-2,4-dienoate hydrolase